MTIHLIRDYGLKDSFDNNSDINIFLILYFCFGDENFVRYRLPNKNLLRWPNDNLMPYSSIGEFPN